MTSCAVLSKQVEPIYVDLASESEEPAVTEIESLCFVCQGMGTTRLLMTRIPHYKEVILSSFDCEHCGNHNTGIQSGAIQDTGVHYELKVLEARDLGRQVVRSDHATVKIPEVELEIPAEGERGDVTTVEGIVKRTMEGLSRDQAVRRVAHPELAEQIDVYILKLSNLLTLNDPFTLKMDDPSGNSFMESLHAPLTDPQLVKSVYQRSKEQNSNLGFAEEDPEKGLDSVKEEEENEEAEENEENSNEEVLTFATLCDKCCRPVDTHMKVVSIPHFKEVIIMALHCEACGNKSNEVKSGSGISERGRRIKLKLTDATYDMARDVLKSETCDIYIPELDLHCGAGILGGKFTTVEGLLGNIKDDLGMNPFLMGDSAESGRQSTMYKLLADLEKVIDGSLPASIVLDDPAGNSYLQNIYAPDDDPEMTIEEYERTYDQNEDLGLNDMKTENYTNS